MLSTLTVSLRSFNITAGSLNLSRSLILTDDKGMLLVGLESNNLLAKLFKLEDTLLLKVRDDIQELSMGGDTDLLNWRNLSLKDLGTSDSEL